MIRMYSEKGGFMDCYNPNEVKRAEAKGWTVVEEPKEPSASKAGMSRLKKARRAKK